MRWLKRQRFVWNFRAMTKEFISILLVKSAAHTPWLGRPLVTRHTGLGQIIRKLQNMALWLSP